jgi:hypothetical protein
MAVVTLRGNKKRGGSKRLSLQGQLALESVDLRSDNKNL